MVHTHRGAGVSLKKGGNSDPATTWMSLEDTMLKEVSQSPKDRHPDELPREVAFTATESRVVAARGGGVWTRELEGSFIWDDENAVGMGGGDGCAITV